MMHITVKSKQEKQESPPAWTQEAYRPPCSEYSFRCSTWVPPPSWPGQGGYLTRVPPRPGYPPILTWLGGYLTRVPPLWPGYPPQPGYPFSRVPPHPDLAGGVPDQGTPPARVPPQPGYPPGRVPPHPDLGGVPDQGTPPARVPPQQGTPPVVPMAFWEMLQSIMGHGYPPTCGQTDWWMDGWMDGQTRVKTLPSRRTTYAGGKKWWSGPVFLSTCGKYNNLLFNLWNGTTAYVKRRNNTYCC